MGDQQTTLSAKERRGADPGRLVAFTDGVFAIIITLLVLDLRVPDLDSGQLLRESLAQLWPTFASFVISFLLVGMYWDWHRTALAQVRFIDRNTVWLTLLFLLPTSMVPFAASALGEYPERPTALHLYGTVLIAATLLRVLLEVYLRRHPGLLWEPAGRQARRLGALTAAAPFTVYAVAMIVADPLPGVAFALYLAMPALYLGLVAFLRTDPRTRVASEDVS